MFRIAAYALTELGVTRPLRGRNAKHDIWDQPNIYNIGPNEMLRSIIRLIFGNPFQYYKFLYRVPWKAN
jgi:hypothetical protein